MRIQSLLITTVLCAAAPAFADSACPAPVTDAVAKLFPGSNVTACKAHKNEFEAKVAKKDGTKAEVDVASDGTILQVEEIIPVAQLPAAVTKALDAKYPKAKLLRAEKMTKPGKESEFEVKFTASGKTKEATFTESGKFIEEE